MTQEWKGDFDGMVERRQIRVLVPYSRTLYFNDKGRERGMTADLRARLRALRQQEVRQAARQAPDHGLHDPDHARQAAAGRRRRAWATSPPATSRSPTSGEDRGFRRARRGPASRFARWWSPGPKSPPIADVDDLSGKTVHVRKASSYYESLRRAERALQEGGQAAGRSSCSCPTRSRTRT